MDRVPTFNLQTLTQLAKGLGDSDQGLTVAQLTSLLREEGIPDVTPKAVSWERLLNALVALQAKHGTGNGVLGCILRAIDPIRYTAAPRTFERRREQLNAVLSSSGITIDENGHVRSTTANSRGG
ncbi:MAG: hypothetical protein ABW133_00375 [Polyangiaceae bacterium]